jgi:hypothetical protein
MKLQKNIQKKFGGVKKITTSLHRKTIFNKTNIMHRIQLDTEMANVFSPRGGWTVCGALYAVE